jgi:hypothetical protein
LFLLLLSPSLGVSGHAGRALPQLCGRLALTGEQYPRAMNHVKKI